MPITSMSRTTLRNPLKVWLSWAVCYAERQRQGPGAGEVCHGQGELVTPNYTDLSYELTTPISGASVSEAGVITAGANSGDGEVTVTYDKVSPALTCVANVSVVGGGGG